MSLIGPNNAIAWAQFRLKGGWKKSLSFTGGAFALLAMFIIGAAKYDPLQATRTLFGWCTGLLGLQTAAVVLMAPGRVANAIRVDIKSGLIESHRLMPTSPIDAVAGYIVGAAIGPLIFFAGIYVLGLFCASGAGVPLAQWTFANLVLLAFSTFIWVLAAYVAFASKAGPGLLIIPLFAMPYASAGGLFSLLPGLTVLISPMAGGTIFDLRTAATMVLPPTYAMAFAMQALVGGILFIAAARRYRTADAIGLDWALGLLLVIAWTLLSVIGLREWDVYEPRGWGVGGKIDLSGRLIATIVTGMVLALAPVSASALAMQQWRRHERLHDPSPMRKPLFPGLVLLAVTIAILLVVYAPSGVPKPALGDVAWSAITIAISLATIYFLCAWLYLGTQNAAIPIIIWVVLFWLVPVFVDLIRYALDDYGESDPIGGISTCSPIGALIVVWTHRSAPLIAGIVMQLLIMTLPLTLRMILRPRRRTLPQAAAEL
jgi:hypothetical protein